MISLSSRWLGRIALAALALYWLALAAGTHLPARGGGSMRFNDKLLHFSGYLGLAVLLGVAVATQRTLTWRILLVLWLLVIGYGVFDELLQLPVPGREADLLDWLADCAGAAVGILAVGVGAKLLKRE